MSFSKGLSRLSNSTLIVFICMLIYILTVFQTKESKKYYFMSFYYESIIT